MLPALHQLARSARAVFVYGMGGGGCNPTSRSLSVVTLGIYRHLAAAVSLQSGLRGILSPQVIDEPRGVGESLADTEALIQVWHGRGEGQIYIWVRFHAPYSGHPESFVQGSALAQRYGVGLHTHLAETRRGVETLQARYGLTPVQCLKRWGSLSAQTLAAHCVHVGAEEIESRRCGWRCFCSGWDRGMELLCRRNRLCGWLHKAVPPVWVWKGKSAAWRWAKKRI